MEPSTLASELPATCWEPAHLQWHWVTRVSLDLYTFLYGQAPLDVPEGWSAALFCTPTPCVDRHSGASGNLI